MAGAGSRTKTQATTRPTRRGGQVPTTLTGSDSPSLPCASPLRSRRPVAPILLKYAQVALNRAMRDRPDDRIRWKTPTSAASPSATSRSSARSPANGPCVPAAPAASTGSA